MGCGVCVVRGLFLASSWVPYCSYVRYAVVSISMDVHGMPVARSLERMSSPLASMSPPVDDVGDGGEPWQECCDV